MSEKEETRSRRAGSEDGFALVLAILALMLLTFLGLTMAATSSTELQIATNYRWSQQALYNAAAGLEAAKVILAPSPPLADWNTTLPQPRGGSWAFGAAPAPLDPVVDPRDYERRGAGCTDRAGIGYGRVLSVGGVIYSNRTSFGGQNLNGSFTLWIRREVVADAAGQFSDSLDNAAAIITSEGVAPYGGTFASAAITTFTRANQATRILETGLGLVTQGGRCQGLAGQEGLSASGENFDPCSPMKADGIKTALGLATVSETGNK